MIVCNGVIKVKKNMEVKDFIYDLNSNMPILSAQRINKPSVWASIRFKKTMLPKYILVYRNYLQVSLCKFAVQ